MAETLFAGLWRHGLARQWVPVTGGAQAVLTRDGKVVGPMGDGAGACLVALLDGKPMPSESPACQKRAQQLLVALRASA